jgi:hypothetical protein
VVTDAGTRQIHQDVGAGDCAFVDRPGLWVPSELVGSVGRTADETSNAMTVLREVTAQGGADETVRARDDDLHTVRVDRGAPTGVWWEPRVTCPDALQPDLGLERALLDASLD